MTAGILKTFGEEIPSTNKDVHHISQDSSPTSRPTERARILKSEEWGTMWELVGYKDGQGDHLRAKTPLEEVVDQNGGVSGVGRRKEHLDDEEFKRYWASLDSRNPWAVNFDLWATRNPTTENAIVWLDGQGEPERAITWKSLRSQTRVVAHYLRTELGIRMGDRVILCFPPGVHFIIGFYACLLTGTVAVPVYPPTPANQTRDGDRFLDIRKRAGVTVILTNQFYLRVARLMFRIWRGGDASDPAVLELGPPQWVSIESAEKMPSEVADSFIPCTVYPWTEAFLQFTSGSTSQPKGVVVTHGNMLHNIALCGKSFGLSGATDDPSSDVCLDMTPLENIIPTVVQRHKISRNVNGHPCRVFSWLPVYHDMGLIGGMLSPLFGGCQLYQTSPLDFIKKPELWMISMSRFKCVACAAPNFAYELAVKQTSDEAAAGLNLNNLTGMICGAEPIRLSAMLGFFKKFKVAGLSDCAIIPAYGLAENTLIASGRKRAHHRIRVLCFDALAYRREGKVVPRGFSTSVEGGLLELREETEELLTSYIDSKGTDFMTLVSCGPPAWGVTIRIVNPKTNEVFEEGYCGEVWISSASTARGYYQMPEKSEEDFTATLKGDHRQYLRSGDTGFVWKGELFLSGRIKDMLVIRGKNYYPQDVEAVIDGIAETRAGCSVVFASDDDSNALCVAAELRDSCFKGGWMNSSSWLPSLLGGADARITASTEFETDDEFYRHVALTICKYAAANVGLKVSKVFLLKGRTLAKTTSGKVRRHAAKTELTVQGKRVKGLLYTHVLADGSNKVEDEPLVSIQRVVLPLCPEKCLEVVFKEAVRIALARLPSTVVPRIPLGATVEMVMEDVAMRKASKRLLTMPLYEVGMDSPAFVSLDERIRRRLYSGFSVFEPSFLLRCPSLSHVVVDLHEKLMLGEEVEEESVADVIEVRQVGENTLNKFLDWIAEILVKDGESFMQAEQDPMDDIKVLCDRIQVSPSACFPVKDRFNWTQVFLTGATGFIGSMQLAYLLELFPNVTVRCLVRAKTHDEALRRLLATRARKQVLEHSTRVDLVLGDITKNHLGLDAECYADLAAQCHVVFHTAADISLARSYSGLRSTNVLATARIIEFASEGQLKPVHFASTLGTYPAYFCGFKKEFKGHYVAEHSPHNFDEMVRIFPPTANGYPWTKVVCELMLRRASLQGLPVGTYRYPLTCMCHEDGFTQQDNVMIPLTLASVQEGIVPRGFVMTANTPADVAACHSVVLGMSGWNLSTVVRPAQCFDLVSWASGNSPKPHRPLTPSELDVLTPKGGHVDSTKYSVIHLCDNRVVSGSHLSEWLEELGVPVDVVDDAWTLVDAARMRGEDSAMKAVLHMTRSPISKYWFHGETAPLSLPVSTETSNLTIRTAYESLGMENLLYTVDGQVSCWPPTREVFKRGFLFMVKEEVMRMSTAAINQNVCAEVLTLREGSDSYDSVSPNRGSNAAFAQAEALRAGVCSRDLAHLSTQGQLMLGMWAKYSRGLASELMPSPSDKLQETQMPPVLVFLGCNRDATDSLTPLLVAAGGFAAPTLMNCLPIDVNPSLGPELLEVYDAVGILGVGQTRAAQPLLDAPNKDLLYSELARQPVEDTLLLEMMPDRRVARSMQCMYGFDESGVESSWEGRYLYHRQYLAKRDCYREGRALVLGSPMHSIHVEELLKTYPNALLVRIASDEQSRSKWEEDAKRIGTSLCNWVNSAYMDRWMNLHDDIERCADEAIREYADRSIDLTHLKEHPFEAVNVIMRRFRESQELATSPKPTVDLLVDLAWRLRVQGKSQSIRQKPGSRSWRHLLVSMLPVSLVKSVVNYLIIRTVPGGDEFRSNFYLYRALRWVTRWVLGGI